MADAVCYYPNGKPAVGGDIPCGSGPGVACCPLNWECRTNGLCYLGNQNYLGRYSCTDQSWQSPSCPQICTYGGTAFGAEAVLECSSGNFCCDANRPDVGCCSNNTQLFTLDDRKRAFNVSSAGPASSAASPALTTTSSSHSLATSAFVTTSRIANGTSVVVLTSYLTQTASSSSEATSSAQSSPSHPNTTPIVVGLLVPLVLIILAALLFFLVRRQHRRRQRPRSNVRHLDPHQMDLGDCKTDPAELSSGDLREKAELPGSGHSRQVESVPKHRRLGELSSHSHDGIPELG